MNYTHIRRPVLDALFNNKAAYIRLVLKFIIRLIDVLSNQSIFVYVRLNHLYASSKFYLNILIRN
jgi:hypothetical protein